MDGPVHSTGCAMLHSVASTHCPVQKLIYTTVLVMPTAQCCSGSSHMPTSTVCQSVCLLLQSACLWCPGYLITALLQLFAQLCDAQCYPGGICTIQGLCSDAWHCWLLLQALATSSQFIWL